MVFKKAIIAAYIKVYGKKEVCKEQFSQAHEDGLKVIKAAFGTYAEFIQEVRAEVAEKSKAPAAKAPASAKK